AWWMLFSPLMRWMRLASVSISAKACSAQAILARRRTLRTLTPAAAQAAISMFRSTAPRAAFGCETSIQAVRPPTCPGRQLGTDCGKPQFERQHNWHHRSWRDRPRNRLAGRRVRNDDLVFSAHAAAAE